VKGDNPNGAEHSIVFLDRATISPETDLRRPNFPHRWIEYDRTKPGEVVERCADATIVILNKVKLPEEAIAKLPRLKLVAVAATGIDPVDVKACAARGVVVSNIRDYAIHTVPEHTFALILALRRNPISYRESVRSGAWQRAEQFCYFDFPIHDLAGSTLGIIGRGAIGQAVAQLARAFGMTVLFSGRKNSASIDPPYTPFEEVLESSDIITLHCPLVPSTRHLIGNAEFARMKRSALLINTARGGLVSEEELGLALRSGQIAGAAFDVATVEPPGPAHPLMGLLEAPNFMLTPHLAWASAEAIQTLADQLIDNLEKFYAGQPANVVL
jgi:glycerate dehydrogenase